jgi:hypothetical protein
METVLAGASAFAVIVTSLVFPFVPNAFAFPWMSLALPLLGEGLVAPTLLHLVARPLALAVPFALAAAALAVGLRRWPFAVIGALLAIVIGSLAPPSPAAIVQRSYIAEVYFTQPGSLQEPVPPSLQRRRQIELALPPAGWPF